MNSLVAIDSESLRRVIASRPHNDIASFFIANKDSSNHTNKDSYRKSPLIQLENENSIGIFSVSPHGSLNLGSGIIENQDDRIIVESLGDVNDKANIAFRATDGKLCTLSSFLTYVSFAYLFFICL